MAALEEGSSFVQSQLRSDRKGFENHYNLAIRYHEQYINKVPNKTSTDCRRPAFSFFADYKRGVKAAYQLH